MIPTIMAMAMVLMNSQAGVNGASAIDVGDCSGFAVMAGTAVSFNGVATSVAMGSVGVSPGTSITGAYVMGDGCVESNDVAAINCAASMLIAYDAAVATNCTNSSAPADLSGLTLGPGVYCNHGGYYVLTAGALTLSGSATDVWIFQAATSVITSTATSIILAGGALASNVFWQVGTTLVTGPDSTFAGTVLAGTSITMGTGSSINGRLLAQAAVSASNGNVITSFVAGSTPASSPTTTAGTSSTGSTSASSLSNGSIAAIVIMSFVGLLAVMALIYYSLSRKASTGESYKQAAGSNNV
jgi:hypothetical protein